MGDEFEQLLLLDAVVDGALEVADLLLGAIERHQGGAGDQAAVTLGEAGPLPDVAEQHVVGQVDQLGRECAQSVAGSRRIGRSLGHVSSLLYLKLSDQGLAWPM